LRLPYSFFKRVDNAIQRNRESKIEAVIKHIEEKVPGAKFDRVHEDSKAVVRIAFIHNHPDGETWSRVGREAERVDSDEPTMNLSDVAGHDSGEIQEGSKEYGDIMHEFFHTLGMLHEHQHPERKFTISEIGIFTYNSYRNLELMELPAVRKEMEDEGWSREDISDNIVQKMKANDIGPFSPPDILSCMK